MKEGDDDCLNIQLNSYSLLSIENRFATELRDLETNIKKLSNLIDNLGNDWQGNDATSYIRTMKERNIEELFTLLDILKEYSNYLKKIPNVYGSLDESFSSRYIG